MVIAALDPQPEPRGLSAQIAKWTATRPAPSPRALVWARHALLDWLGVTIAGAREPLSILLRDELAQGGGPCTLIGAGTGADLHNAALINGAGWWRRPMSAGPPAIWPASGSGLRASSPPSPNRLSVRNERPGSSPRSMPSSRQTISTP